METITPNAHESIAVAAIVDLEIARSSSHSHRPELALLGIGLAPLLALASTMSEDVQRRHMRAMRTQVSESNVYRWAGRMLVDAARLRRRETVLGRLDPSIARLANISR